MIVKILGFIFVSLYMTNDDGAFAIRTGLRAGPTEMLYTVSIHKRGIQVCTGTIIGKHWVLTRAICINRDQELFTVIHSTLRLQESPSVTYVVNIFLRTTGVNRSRLYDVGIAKVGSDFLFYNENTLALPQVFERFPEAIFAVLSGWTTYDNIHGGRSTQLSKLVVDMRFTFPANTLHRFLIQNDVCGLDNDIDRGAPLVCEGTLIGIAYKHGNEEVPDDFIRASTHSEWLAAITNEAPNNQHE